MEFEDYIKNDNVGSENFRRLLEMMEHDTIVLDDIPDALNVSENNNEWLSRV